MLLTALFLSFPLLHSYLSCPTCCASDLRFTAAALLSSTAIEPCLGQYIILDCSTLILLLVLFFSRVPADQHATRSVARLVVGMDYSSARPQRSPGTQILVAFLHPTPDERIEILV